MKEFYEIKSGRWKGKIGRKVTRCMTTQGDKIFLELANGKCVWVPFKIVRFLPDYKEVEA